MENHGELGVGTCQLPWCTMENLVWEPVNTHGEPCRVGASGHSHGVPSRSNDYRFDVVQIFFYEINIKLYRLFF